MLASEIRYTQCNDSEVAYATGMNCVPLTTHRVLRSQKILISYDKIYKDLETDETGTSVRQALKYLGKHVTLTLRYVAPGLDTKHYFDGEPQDIILGNYDKPTTLTFLWIGLYNGGCHTALCRLEFTPINAKEMEVTYTISHSGRMSNWFMEEVMDPEEFWARTWGMWEVSKK